MVAARNSASPSNRNSTPTPPTTDPLVRAATSPGGIWLFRFRHEAHRLANEMARVGSCLRRELLRAAKNIVAGVDVPLRIQRELVEFAEAARHGPAGMPRVQLVALRVELHHVGGLVVGHPDDLLAVGAGVARGGIGHLHVVREAD